MPKQQMRFIKKLKMVKSFWFSNSEKILYEHCSFCGSTKIDSLKRETKNVSSNFKVYSAYYECTECRAICSVTEYWSNN